MRYVRETKGYLPVYAPRISAEIPEMHGVCKQAEQGIQQQKRSEEQGNRDVAGKHEEALLMSYVWQSEVDQVRSKIVWDAIKYLEDGTPPPMPSSEPISQRNEHNVHSAAKVVAGVIILLLIAGVSWIFWLEASQ